MDSLLASGVKEWRIWQEIRRVSSAFPHCHPCFLKIFWPWYTACGILDLCSLTRDRTPTPCIRSAESSPLDHPDLPFSAFISILCLTCSSKTPALLGSLRSIYSLFPVSITLFHAHWEPRFPYLTSSVTTAPSIFVSQKSAEISHAWTAPFLLASFKKKIFFFWSLVTFWKEEEIDM